MDLEHRGLTNFANLVLNRYLDLTDEDDGLPAMPLFLSLRAAIRAHVTATAMDRAAHAESKLEMAAEACRYLDLAARCARDPVASSPLVVSADRASRPSALPSPRKSAQECCAAT
jgi:aminoglycoside phosphotransferase family enzyme